MPDKDNSLGKQEPNTPSIGIRPTAPFVKKSSPRLKKAASDYNKTKPMVRMPDGAVICENSGIDTLVKVIQWVGYEEVDALHIFPWGKNKPLLVHRSVFS